MSVAPRAGAWVETRAVVPSGMFVPSHPVRVRGLKRIRCNLLERPRRSHPVRVRGLKLVQQHQSLLTTPSHPVRVRGLKRELIAWYVTEGSSHPVRVRGLKPRIPFLCRLGCFVAPRAGAWVET